LKGSLLAKRDAVLYLAFFSSGCKQSNPSTHSKVEKKITFKCQLTEFSNYWH